MREDPRVSLQGVATASSGVGTCRTSHRASVMDPDDGEADPLFPGCLEQSVYVGGAYVQVFGKTGSAGVARGGVDFSHPGALSQLPDQGVLPSAAADYQYVQSLSPRVVINLTPCVPLSTLGEGGGSFVKGLRPFKLPLFYSPLQTTLFVLSLLVSSS